MRVDRYYLFLIVLLAVVTTNALAAAMTIPQVKMLADGAVVDLTGVVTYADKDFFYLQQVQGISGIRVEAANNRLQLSNYLQLEQNASDLPTMRTNSNGERYVHVSGTVFQPAFFTAKPVAMTCKSIAGGDWSYDPVTGAGQMGLPTSSGQNNVGMYITACGNCTPIDESSFILDDSSGVKVKCICAPGLTIDTAWEHATANGVVSLYRDPETNETKPMLYVSCISGDSPGETISAPGKPIGDLNPSKGEEAGFITTGAVSSQRRQIEYSFNWGDGVNSPWSTSTSASHTWTTLGPRTVTVTARSKAQPSLMACSEAVTVNVAESGIEWVQQDIQGPFNIPVSSIKCARDGVAYLASNGSITHTTHDGGVSWQNCNLLPDYDTIIPSPNGAWFACSGSGLIRSVDNMETWQVVLSSVSGKHYAISPSGHVFVRNSNLTMSRSTDNGDTWNVLPASPSNFGSVVISPSGHVYALKGLELYRSTDNGDTWQKTTFASGVSQVVFQPNGRVIALCDGSTADNMIRISTDDGATWTPPVASGLPTSGTRTLSSTHSGDTAFVLISGNGLYRSTDGGVSWAACNTGVASPGNAKDMYIDSQDRLFLKMGNPATGLYRSVNSGDTWERILTHAGTSHIDAFAIGSNDKIYAAVYGEGVRVSSDHGDTWINGHIICASIASMLALPNGTVFANQFRTTDRGASWTTTTMPVGLQLASDGTNVYSATMNVIYRSTDNGDNWTSCRTKGTGTDPYSIFGSLNGSVYCLESLTRCLRSTDGGTNWNQILAPSEGIIRNIVFGADNKLVANVTAGAFGSTIYVSDSNGDSWSQYPLAFPKGWMAFELSRSPNGCLYAYCSSLALPLVPIRKFMSMDNGATWSQTDMGILPTVFGPGNMCFAYGGGVYISKNGGATWTSANKGLSLTRVKCLAIDSAGYLYAGTEGAGVYRTKNPVTQ